MTRRWLLAGAFALAACTEPRQIVLSIDSVAGVNCDIDRIRGIATATGTIMFEQTLKDSQLPVTVTLLDDTSNGAFQLDIVALKGDVEVMHTRGPLQFSNHKANDRVLLDPKCTADAPCELSDSMSAGAASPVASRFACRYTSSPGLETFVDACTVPGSKSVLADGSHIPVQADLADTLAGSEFQFYGHAIRQLWISKDGYVSFAKDNPDPTGTLIPGPLDRGVTHMGVPPPPWSVMVFWDTLSLGASGVCYVVEGDAPNRQLRVTWEHACLTDVCTSDNLNFTITLEESTHRVVLSYGTMIARNPDGALGGSATVGLVDDPTGCRADECTFATGQCKDGVTPCGYSQEFSETVQSNGLPNMQFIPTIGK